MEFKLEFELKNGKPEVIFNGRKVDMEKAFLRVDWNIGFGTELVFKIPNGAFEEDIPKSVGEALDKVDEAMGELNRQRDNMRRGNNA